MIPEKYSLVEFYQLTLLLSNITMTTVCFDAMRKEQEHK
jgi:hypothetical protein